MSEQKTAEFDGVKTTNIKNWKEVFEEQYNDDGYLYLIQKNSNNHEDPQEDNSFSYHMAIEAVDLMRASGNANATEIVFKLYLMVDPECWCDSKIKEALIMCGMEDVLKEGRTKAEIAKCITIQDAIGVGAVVLIAQDAIGYDIEDNEGEGWYDILENKDAEAMIDAAASNIEGFMGLYGFRCDKVWNRIGNTGWDTIDSVLHGTDIIKTAIKRFQTEGSIMY